MINKQRKPRLQFFSLGVAIVYTFLFLNKEAKICFTIATNRQIRTVTNAKVLFFLNVSTLQHWWCIIQFLLKLVVEHTCWSLYFPIQTIFPLRTPFRLKRCLLTLFYFCLNSARQTHLHKLKPANRRTINNCNREVPQMHTHKQTKSK